MQKSTTKESEQKDFLCFIWHVCPLWASRRLLSSLISTARGMQRELLSVIMLLTWQICSTFHFFQHKKTHQIGESSELLAPSDHLFSIHSIHFIFCDIIFILLWRQRSAFTLPSRSYFILIIVSELLSRSLNQKSFEQSFSDCWERTSCNKTWWNWDQIKTWQSPVLLFISIWEC